MKKMKKIIYLFLFLILGAISCELPDNVDPKAASEVDAAAVFTSGQLSLIDHIDDVSVNWNVLRLFTQYWQQTTYFDESRYLLVDRNIPESYWTRFYRDVLADLQEAKRLASAEAVDPAIMANRIALIDVLEVYAWQTLVDGFGNVPYSEALMGMENVHPVYDDAAGIYTDLLAQISTAIATMDVNAESFGAADLLYGGDVASWRIFAASLKLRMAMRLADVNPSAAQTNAEAAITSGVFSTAGSGAILHYIGVSPRVNQIYDAYVTQNRKDYLPTSSIIEPMKTLSDPRLPLWFTTVDTSTVAGTSPEVYWGAIAGLDGAQSYNNFSHFAAEFFEATFPAVLMDYMEVEFLLAEAAERGYAGVGTAESHYNNAITESITGWGGSVADAATYLAQPEVAYTTATGTWRQVIGEQKWFGLYNRGVEAWAEWRRLDYPVLTPPEGMTAADMPVRFHYPVNESKLNADNHAAASSAIGGDEVGTRLFWDVN